MVYPLDTDVGALLAVHSLLVVVNLAHRLGAQDVLPMFTLKQRWLV